MPIKIMIKYFDTTSYCHKANDYGFCVRAIKKEWPIFCKTRQKARHIQMLYQKTIL